VARPELRLTSTANPRVKALVGLRRRRSRDQHEVTLVDGRDELVLALDAGTRPRTLYYCPDLVDEQDRATLVPRVAALGAEVIQVSRQVFEKVAYRDSPDGWLAEIPSVQCGLDALRLKDNPLLLVCESVEKPGNLGAMLRTADAAGLDAVIAADPVADWGNPNVIRASKGTVFSVQVATAAPQDAVAWLRQRSIAIVATTPDTDVVFTGVDYRGPTAVVVGAEKHGLSDPWLDRADAKVRIPMYGHADSLNVATSAALVVYEALRQRTANFRG
jgi:TrmH family RNA methyltransferase